jgi:hypothetical protein
VLETQLALGASFVRGDWIDGAINPLCGLDCALVPVLTPGPLLHPRILTDGLSPDGSLSLPTTLTLHWIDKTDAASGTQTRDVARATQGFTPIGFPPNYVALVDGAVPYTYLTFRPHGAPPLVGHVYEISATWTDAGMLAFAESPPVTVKFVPNPTTTTAAWDDASLPVGSVPTLRASAHGSYGAHLPTCCDNFPDSPGPTAVTGTYTATLTSGNDGIAMRSTVGASVSWDDWPVLPVGTYSVLVAVESSNPNWRDSFVTLPLTITRTPTAASIGVSPSAAPWDTPRQVAASLTAPGSLIAETPTGEVQFSLERIGGWAPLGAAVLDEFGAAVLEVDPGELAGLDPGDYAIHAVYSGDALHLASSAGSTLTVTERPAVVPLPATLPAASDGTLDGVPDESDPGQRFQVEATGFAPFAPVTFGIYSTPQLLATVNADANGIAVATLEIPSELRGPHTVAAIGLGPSSDPLVLTAATTVRTPLFNLPALGTSATPPLLLLTLLSLGLGFVLLLARRLGLHAGRRT